ncbi:hypothetical protein C0J52_17567 [Blattella germanica]|nr:hypothetical protein C0J52_17567 [Blattella germanica]
MKATILLSLQLFFSVVTATFVLDKPDCCQERCYSAMDLISNCRCRGEKHHVTTTDGYKLEMHRIQHCHPAPNIKGKPVVLLMHGFFSCSNDFILQCNQSLGFKLAELGYDVWLGNVRGSTYSREHVDLHTDIPDYWNFRRIRVAVALSPIAHLGDTTDKLLKSLAKISEPLKEVIGKTRDKEVFPHLNLYSDLALKTCCISEDSCRKFFTATTLKETNNMDASILPQIMCYDPTGSSLGTFSHYLQLINSGKFCMYDWGKDKNLEVYDSVEPPEYPLEEITCPVYMIASQKDELATYTNVRRTCEKIGDNCELYVTPDSTLSHSDFLFSRQAPYEIYNIVIEYINRHSPAPLVPQCPSLKCLH